MAAFPLTDEEYADMEIMHKKERENYENQDTSKNSYKW